MKKGYKLVLKALCMSLMPTISGCFSAPAPDLSELENFVEYNFPNEKPVLSDSVDLFIDYSSCVAQARTSPWYNATHPSIVDCSPTFYSIKGNKIKKETSDRQQVYQLLSAIKEVNNADIKSAVNMIVNADHQAVLISDCEYYLSNMTRDNLNNPYLAEEFRIWLSKGYDIYIYSEPYLESNKYSKYRYYMFFTDRNIPNNVHDKFARSVPQNSNVKLLHLYDGVPNVTFAKNYPEINPSLSPNPEVTRHNQKLDVEEYFVSLSDIHKYLAGNDLETNYLFRGLFVNNSSSDCYAVKEIDAVVYQIYDEYSTYCDSLAVNGNRPEIVPLTKLKKVKNIFKIKEEIFEETGEDVLMLDEDFDEVGDRLSSKHGNLLRVDIVVSEAKDNFTDNPDLNSCFRWTSMSSVHSGMENTSIFQSISQVVSDPVMNPETNKKVIYTVYINTPSI